MRSQIAHMLAAAIGVLPFVGGHFVLNEPASIGFDEEKLGEGPCGSFDATLRSNVTQYPIGGYPVSFMTTHNNATWEFRAALLADTSDWVSLTPKLDQSGTGTFCEPQVPGYAAWVGRDAVFQIVQHGDDGAMYQCAAIKFVDGGPYSGSCPCENSTSTITATWAPGPTSPISPTAAPPLPTSTTTPCPEEAPSQPVTPSTVTLQTIIPSSTVTMLPPAMTPAITVTLPPPGVPSSSAASSAASSAVNTTLRITTTFPEIASLSTPIPLPVPETVLTHGVPDQGTNPVIPPPPSTSVQVVTVSVSSVPGNITATTSQSLSTGTRTIQTSRVSAGWSSSSADDPPAKTDVPAAADRVALQFYGLFKGAIFIVIVGLII